MVLFIHKFKYNRVKEKKMKSTILTFAAVSIVISLSGCATPHVVDTKKLGTVN